MAQWNYPAARRDESAVDDYHGTKVADPYRWLEDPDSEETKEFVTKQNDLSMPYLKNHEVWPKFNKRMTELYDYPKYGTPFKEGSRFFYYYNTGLQNHSVLYVQSSLKDEGTVFLDPNKLSEDGTTALSSISFSHDGELVAYGLSKGGSDWVNIHVKRVADGQDLADELQWAKFTCLAWTHDNKGFFYNRYDAPKQVQAGEKLDAGTETDINLNHKLYYHVVGTKQEEDVLCFQTPDHPKWMSGAQVTDDGKYILLLISEGCEPVNRLYYAPVGPIVGPIEFTKVIDNFDAQYEYLANDGSVFTFKTNLNAPRYRVVRTDFALATPEQPVAWTEVIPQNADVLEWVLCVNNDKLVSAYLRDVKSVLELRRLSDGSVLTTFDIPVGHVVSCTGKREQSDIFFKFVSFLAAGTIYHCELSVDAIKPEVFRETEVKGFDPGAFVTEQRFYHSKDGTRIPCFIVHRKDIKLDGSNPTMLYGYGGFNISITPSFSVSRLVFCQHFAGVFVVANIRGGGEYGEDWHKAGTMGKKQNVFDDFHAAAEFLIKEGYASPKTLAIQGGSNGGLLVGACINQRPELYGCALAHVGVMDMLKFHKFTIGHAWTTDYGCSDTAEDFAWLHAYSPVHNVRVGPHQYPSTLLLTGDHDDRVVPLHSLKLIATLQHALGSDSKQTNPLLIRVEVKAGHGAGKPTAKVIEETTDMYTFIARSIGCVWHD